MPGLKWIFFHLRTLPQRIVGLFEKLAIVQSERFYTVLVPRLTHATPKQDYR